MVVAKTDSKKGFNPDSEDFCQIFLIDFGSTYQYCNELGVHKSKKVLNKYPGNLLFASMNICRGVNPCPNDDIESIIYVLIFLLNC